MKRDNQSALKSRLCLVCSDQSNGYNFGALSCESCKAFFRRNAKKNLLGKCEFDNQCIITTKTRKFCGPCRLAKCMSVGMKESAILDETERIARQDKVKANRERRASKSSYGIVSHPSVQPQLSPLLPSVKVEGNLPLLKTDSSSDDVVVGLDHPPPHQHHQQHQPRAVAECPVSTTTVSSSSINSLPLPLSSSVTTEGGGGHSYGNKLISLNTLLAKDNAGRLLTQDEWNNINDLRQAFESSFLSYDLPPEGSYTLSNLVNTSGFIVRKLINFAKKLSDFSQLQQECQVALLKGVVLNTLFLRSASYYDVERDVWITPNGYIPTTILAEVTGLQRLYEEHSKYCRTFRSIVGNDNTIVALMQVLCLFSPERDKVPDRQHIAGVQDRYVLLLKHYLEAQYGYVKARHLITNVLCNLDELQNLTDRHGIVLWRIDPSTIDPLMLEVFSLNEVHLLARNSPGSEDMAAFDSFFDALTANGLAAESGVDFPL